MALSMRRITEEDALVNGNEHRVNTKDTDHETE